MVNPNLRSSLALLALLLLPFLGACAAYQRDATGVQLMQRGEYGTVRAHVLAQQAGEREAILQRMKRISLALADGVHDSARTDADALFDDLRTQGINADRTASSFFVGEQGARIYKGEPFEQALAYYNIAVVDALDGEWGNVRAAAQNSLFLLRDFSQSVQTAGQSPLQQREAIVRQGAEADAKSGKQSDGLGVNYLATASDFEIGYVLRAIASFAVNEHDDAEEALRTVTEVAPRLAPLADAIRSGGYNTVVFADFGTSPEKYADGPSNAIALFRPRTPSDDRPLLVSVDGGPAASFPVVTDVNRISQSLRWANLEDLRLAKSAIGDVLITGGVIAIGASGRNDNAAKWAGLGAILAGVALKATASADTRQNEYYPQRVYVALLALNTPSSTVDLSIEGAPGTRLVLPGVPKPRAGFIQAVYARLPSDSDSWGASGRVLYSNDATGAVEGTQLPYILGGNCVRTPSAEVLESYHRSGYLKDITSVNDLVDLYKEEGINVVGWDSNDTPGLHVLEGGHSLYTPSVGSTGFVRLFDQPHPAYVPKSPRVKALYESIRAARAAEPPPQNSMEPGEPGRVESGK